MSTDLAEYISVTMSHEKRKELTSEKPSEDMDIGALVFSHPRPINFNDLPETLPVTYNLRNKD